MRILGTSIRETIPESQYFLWKVPAPCFQCVREPGASPPAFSDAGLFLQLQDLLRVALTAPPAAPEWNDPPASEEERLRGGSETRRVCFSQDH